MRILQICPYDIDRPGGVQRHILDLADALRGHGHEVTIIAPAMARDDNGDSLETPGVARLGKGRLLSFNKTAFEFSWAARSERPAIDELLESADIVHFHTMTTPFLSWQIFARSKRINVATFHDFPPDTFFGALQIRLYRLLTAWLARRLDGVIVTTTAMQHVARDRAAVSAVLPPCTALSRFGPDVAPAVEFPDDRVNILFLGRLEPRKGAGVLLEAYARLEHEGAPARLIIVGDGPEREKLKTFVAAQRLQHVHFIGATPRDSAPQWYAGCDIFCAPSLYGEGFGIVLTEAMASGKPVVAADNSGYRMVLPHGSEQAPVPSGDVDALHARLKALVLDKDLRERFGQQGRKEARQYDVQNLAPDFVRFYERAIAERA